MRHDHGAQLKLAAERLDGTAKHTQLIASPVLSEMTGHTILLKPRTCRSPVRSRSAVPTTRLHL